MDRDALRSALGARWRGALPDDAGLDALAQGLADASAAEGIAPGDPAFLSHVLARLDPALPPSEAVRALHLADLALAFACARGEPAALARFERRVGEEIRRVARGSRLRGQSPEDVEQIVRERLLVAAPGARPRVEGYSGKGPLKSWVRSAAARVLVNLAEAQPREEPDDSLEAQLAAGAEADDGLRPLREKFRDRFRRAFPIAVRALPKKERAALRARFVGRKTVEEIAAEHGVHVATVARWLASGREHLAEEMKAIVLAAEKVSPSELESIVRWMRPELELTVEQLLITVE